MPKRPLATLALVSLIALLAACTGSGDGEGGVPARGALLTVIGWPSGQAGEARFLAEGTLVTSAAVNGGGLIGYSLPVPPGLLEFDPADGIVIDPPDALFQVITAIGTTFAGGAGEIRIGSRAIPGEPVAGDTVAELWFVDRDVRITGTSEGCSFDQVFQEGWNYSITRVISAAPAFTCELTASPRLPDGIRWFHVVPGG